MCTATLAFLIIVAAVGTVAFILEIVGVSLRIFRQTRLMDEDLAEVNTKTALAGNFQVRAYTPISHPSVYVRSQIVPVITKKRDILSNPPSIGENYSLAIP